jgi:hypothetical protein
MSANASNSGEKARSTSNNNGNTTEHQLFDSWLPKLPINQITAIKECAS